MNSIQYAFYLRNDRLICYIYIFMAKRKFTSCSTYKNVNNNAQAKTNTRAGIHSHPLQHSILLAGVDGVGVFGDGGNHRQGAGSDAGVAQHTPVHVCAVGGGVVELSGRLGHIRGLMGWWL